MDPYVGEIRLFAGDFAPMDWLFCEGQTVSVHQYQGLFSVIGIQFGGDGKDTFALPDLRGLAVMHQGQGDGLSSRTYGTGGGTNVETLSEKQMPDHDHYANVQTSPNSMDASGNIWASSPGGKFIKKVYATQPTAPMHPDIVNSIGGGQAHNNIQPFLRMNYIIACYGVYPIKA